MKAYRTVLYGEPSIIKARSRSAARAATIRSARDAGYETAFTEPCRVRRAPEFDRLTMASGRCFRQECAEEALRDPGYRL